MTELVSVAVKSLLSCLMNSIPTKTNYFSFKNRINFSALGNSREELRTGKNSYSHPAQSKRSQKVTIGAKKVTIWRRGQSGFLSRLGWKNKQFKLYGVAWCNKKQRSKMFLVVTSEVFARMWLWGLTIYNSLKYLHYFTWISKEFPFNLFFIKIEALGFELSSPRSEQYQSTTAPVSKLTQFISIDDVFVCKFKQLLFRNL